MYLKSLDINGFKSFYEKTSIDFSNKVNVIVGPNGSGKSNVVDAISWVLGTQSPATLRTNKMEDVIFAGTEKLSQKGFAEVYLNFEVDEKLFNGNSDFDSPWIVYVGIGCGAFCFFVTHRCSGGSLSRSQSQGPTHVGAMDERSIRRLRKILFCRSPGQ